VDIWGGIILGFVLGFAFTFWASRTDRAREEDERSRKLLERHPYMPSNWAELERWADKNYTLREELTRVREKEDRELAEELWRTPEERQALIKQAQQEAREYHAKLMEIEAARKRRG
jgi:hypothetical protein